MSDPIDPAKANAAAYAKASDSYAKAMDAEAKKKLAEGAATAKMADTAAQQAAKTAPPIMADVNSDAYKQQKRARDLAAAAKPILDKQAIIASNNRGPAGQAVQLANAGALSPQRGGLGVPTSPSPIDNVQNYQDTIEAKRAGMLGYDPAAAAAAVPAAIDKYQAATEAPRVLPGHSLGEPIPSVAVSPGSLDLSAAALGAPSSETPKKQSAVDKLIESMGPNFWDILQAAAAGWNFQTPAYVERKKASQAKAAEIEKLSKTAQFEKALQEERLSFEGEQNQARLAASAKENAARIEAELEAAGIRKGIGTIPGATKGQSLGIGLIQGIKAKKPAVVVPSSGGAH